MNNTYSYKGTAAQQSDRKEEVLLYSERLYVTSGLFCFLGL